MSSLFSLPYQTRVQLWKSYAYTRNQRIQQLSPFEVDILGPLFKDIGGKVKHKLEVGPRRSSSLVGCRRFMVWVAVLRMIMRGLGGGRHRHARVTSRVPSSPVPFSPCPRSSSSNHSAPAGQLLRRGAPANLLRVSRGVRQVEAPGHAQAPPRLERLLGRCRHDRLARLASVQEGPADCCSAAAFQLTLYCFYASSLSCIGLPVDCGRVAWFTTPARCSGHSQ